HRVWQLAQSLLLSCYNGNTTTFSRVKGDPHRELQKRPGKGAWSFGSRRLFLFFGARPSSTATVNGLE
ncbi:MAG: hypothetical protein ACRER5_21575, partial [Pseudomonas sp.]